MIRRFSASSLAFVLVAACAHSSPAPSDESTTATDSPSTPGERGDTPVTADEPEPTPSRPVAGGGPDAHGCVHDGGYLWGERDHACVRPWELARERGFESSQENFERYCSGH